MSEEYPKYVENVDTDNDSGEPGKRSRLDGLDEHQETHSMKSIDGGVNGQNHPAFPPKATESRYGLISSFQVEGSQVSTNIES